MRDLRLWVSSTRNQAEGRGFGTPWAAAADFWDQGMGTEDSRLGSEDGG